MDLLENVFHYGKGPCHPYLCHLPRSTAYIYIYGFYMLDMYGPPKKLSTIVSLSNKKQW